MSKMLTAKLVREIWAKRGAREIKAPKMTLRQAEKMADQHWNEAIKLAAWIAEAFTLEGLTEKEHRLVRGVQRFIAKSIRKNKAKALSREP